ncbi:helicase HerA domain-containing protein [Cohaesibacter celericrescens]|uniref:Helicase HerA central domain-containing protein n=1 Tax=Cohaesibacter celericrescens TaxID=2067669 RepID=A0A2N5XLQ3_9HYPH|nr:DUF87 domain-containing protein [Cohaesibacter celericrescens]PLW75405.1 hypothetical protein C0081_20275 [Cohaesibacter celericrescens]
MSAKNRKITCIFGRQGSGKSTITKAMLKAKTRKRVIVFDTQREYEGRGWKRVHSLADLLKVIKPIWKKGFRISYVPPADNLPKELSDLCHLIEMLQAPYAEGKHNDELTLVIEEANQSYPVTALPAGVNGMQRAVLQGRHWGVELIAVSQRPALVNMSLRSGANSTYVFALASSNDVRGVMELIVGKSRAVQDHLIGLEPFCFWRIENGRYQTGKTLSGDRYRLN